MLYLSITLAFHSMYSYSDSSAFIFNFESPALTDGSLLLVTNTRHIHKDTSIQRNKLRIAQHLGKPPTKRELVLRP